MSDVRNYKPNKAAKHIAEALSNKGIQVERLPPSDVERTLHYSELSDYLDAVVLDICRVCPDFFLLDGHSNMPPVRVKAYLYAVAMHHLRRAGAFASSSGVMPPACTGAYVPNCLLAWLQYIGTYAEGDIMGKPTYNFPSAIPVLNNYSIVSGTPSETQLCNSSLGLRIGQFAIDPTYNEATMQFSVALTDTFIQNWEGYADKISDLFQRSDYPCSPMWDEPPPVPDASFYAFPTAGGYTAVARTMLLLTCPFIRWNEEIAALYYNTLRVNSGAYDPGFTMATRMGPMDCEWPSSSLSTTSFDDPWFARKEMFVFILRGVTYKPGMTTKQLRVYFGDPLKRFVIVPIPIDLIGYHEVLAKALIQVGTNGAGFDNTSAYALMLVHDTALNRKLQLSTLGLAGDASNVCRLLVPTQADQLTVLAPVAQIINELGPVVRNGMLHCPLRPDTFASTVPWYNHWADFGSAGGSYNLYSWAIRKTLNNSNPVLKWSTQHGNSTIDATWVTNFGGLPGHLRSSWAAVFRAHMLMTKYVSTGQAYGKGDILYPVSKGPRGGVSMLAASLPAARLNEDIASQTFATWTLDVHPLQAIYSCVPVAGPEITMAALTRYRRGSNAQNNSIKYERIWNNMGENSMIDRYVSVTLGPGGTFIDALSEAMRKRHGDMDMNSGLSAAGDNVDACLWDAVKAAVGTLAGTLQPAAGKAAALGCGAIPLVGGVLSPYCQDAATALVGYIKDSALTSTNRHASMPAKEEQKLIAKTVKSMPTVQRGELPEVRPPRPTAGMYEVLKPHSTSDDEGSVAIRREINRKLAGRNIKKRAKLEQRIKVFKKADGKIKVKVGRSNKAQLHRQNVRANSSRKQAQVVKRNVKGH